MRSARLLKWWEWVYMRLVIPWEDSLLFYLILSHLYSRFHLYSFGYINSRFSNTFHLFTLNAMMLSSTLVMVGAAVALTSATVSPPTCTASKDEIVYASYQSAITGYCTPALGSSNSNISFAYSSTSTKGCTPQDCSAALTLLGSSCEFLL